MHDADPNREQLIGELVELRRQVAQLQGSLPGFGAGRATRQDRHELRADIEFIGDFDVVRATGLDVSEGGLCFEVRDPLPFEMQLVLDGTRQRHRAHLVWARQLPDGGYRLGFRFVAPEPHAQI